MSMGDIQRLGRTVGAGEVQPAASQRGGVCVKSPRVNCGTISA